MAALELRAKGPKTTEVEARLRLAQVGFVPVESVHPLGSEIWDGDSSQRTIPTSIAATIHQASIHLTVMDFHSTETGALPGYASHPVSRRTAIRHVLIPPDLKGQKINGDDPLVARRRLGEVPATLNAPALVQKFFQEAAVETVRVQANEQLDAKIRGERVIPHQADIAGIRARYMKRLQTGENHDRVALDTIIDLVDAVWTARDQTIEHTRVQRKTHRNWRDNEANAREEHAAELAADRPIDFDGKPHEPEVVYEYAAYEHHDDPPIH